MIQVRQIRTQILAITLLAVFSSLARAQAVKPPVAPLPQADPGRPTISNPAEIPPVGYVQFEQGFLQANGSPSLAGQFSLVQTARLSLASRLMVQFSSQPLAISSPGNGTALQVDPGDLVAGVQAVPVEGHGRAPAIALGYQRRVRAGTAPDIDIGGFSQSAILFVSGDLRGYHCDSNFIVSEQGDTLRRAQYGQTLSVSHNIFAEQLHNDLSLSGELWHFTQPLVNTTRDGHASPRSNAVGTLWALAYTVRPNLVLDGGFDRGLTSTSTAWQVFAGFTYLLPHRLWRRHAP